MEWSSRVLENVTLKFFGAEGVPSSLTCLGTYFKRLSKQGLYSVRTRLTLFHRAGEGKSKDTSVTVSCLSQ